MEAKKNAATSANLLEALQALTTGELPTMKPPSMSASGFMKALELKRRWLATQPKPPPPTGVFLERPFTVMEREPHGPKYYGLRDPVEKNLNDWLDERARENFRRRMVREPPLDDIDVFLDPRQHALNMFEADFPVIEETVDIPSVKSVEIPVIASPFNIPSTSKNADGFSVSLRPRYGRDMVVFLHENGRKVITTRARLLGDISTTHLDGSPIPIGMNPGAYILYECVKTPDSTDPKLLLTQTLGEIPYLNMNSYNPNPPFDRVMISIAQIKRVIFSVGTYYSLVNRRAPRAEYTKSYSVARYNGAVVVSGSHCQEGTYFDIWNLALIANPNFV